MKLAPFLLVAGFAWHFATAIFLPLGSPCCWHIHLFVAENVSGRTQARRGAAFTILYRVQ